MCGNLTPYSITVFICIPQGCTCWSMMKMGMDREKIILKKELEYKELFLYVYIIISSLSFFFISLLPSLQWVQKLTVIL